MKTGYKIGQSKTMKWIISLLLSVLSITSYAQISGKVTSDDEPNGAPIVSIIISGTNIGTTTDFDGNYHLDVTNGEYDLVFSFISYQSDTVHVIVDGPTVVNNHLKSQSFNIQEVVVEFKVSRETENILLMDRKKTTEVTQNIGSTELRKLGVSNVSEGLTKVTGISTQSNYLFIRGMGDRYNNAYLNGLPLPSIDPDNKVMPMDIFPTRIIKNLNVNKSFNANSYGDFSGGYLDIRTKDYPNDLLVNINIGTSANTQSFRTFSSFDDVNFNSSERLPLAYNSNITLGNYYKLKDHRIGFLLNGYQRNQFRYQYGNITTTNAQGVKRIDYVFNDYRQRVDYSGLASLYYSYKDHSINFNSLLINSNSYSHRETRGYHFDYLDSIYTRRFTPFERQLLINQLIGKSKFNDFIIDWGVSQSNVKSSENNRRQLVYLYDGDNYRINDIDILDNHRFYSFLDESELSGRLNLSYQLNKLRFDLGYNYKDKQRQFDYQQYMYNFIDPDLMNDINDPDKYIISNSVITEVLNPASKYDASVKIHSTYLVMDYKSDKVSFNIGSRLENSLQLITYRDQQQPLFFRTQLIDNISLLPSLNIKYNLNKDDLLRLSFSKTLSRPSFREVAPFEYTEVFAGIKSIGNPTLTNSSNYNLDLRWENYNKTSDLFSVTAFGKWINDPIEKTMLATASGQLQSFSNADYAYVYGGEIEYKRLFHINSISSIRVNSNLTLLRSVAKVDVNGGNIQTNSVRPLQGSSPVLCNIDASYMRKWRDVESTVTLSYNFYGRRLWSVGIQGMGDVYQNGVNTLNLVIRNKVKEKWGINFSAKNILNPTWRTTQSTFDGDVDLNSFRRGIDLSLSVSYNL